MYGNGFGFGYGRRGGFGGGRGAGFGAGFGFGRGAGYGFGRGFWANDFAGLSELDWLKRYKEHLELRMKDFAVEIKSVEQRIADLEGRNS